MPRQRKINLLAIDLGTSMGWAHNAARNGRVVFGTENLKRPDERESLRYHRLAQWLTPEGSPLKTRPWNLDAIIYEEVARHVSTRSAHVYGGLRGILLSHCEAHNLPCIGVGVMVLKAATAGNGRASKDQMMSAVISMGYNIKTHDEADAVALLIYARTRARIIEPDPPC